MPDEALLARARAKGTDEEFREWVKHQPSCISRAFSEWDHELGVGYCIPAHIRHVSRGSGTATKPEYSCVPVTNAEHQNMHRFGDSYYFPKAEWADMADEYLEMWINS